MNSKLSGSLIFAVLLAVSLVLPFMVKGLRGLPAHLVLVYAIAILGLNLLTGFNGQFSLGHGAFFAIGAYTAAILMDQFGMSLRGDAAGRRRSPASSSACCSACRRCGWRASTWRWPPSRSPRSRRRSSSSSRRGLDRRRAGHRADKPTPPFGLPLSEDQWLYFFTLAVGLAALFRGAQYGRQPHRPGDDGDPRESDRGAGDGRQQRASTRR